MSRLEGGKEDGKNDDPTSLPPRALFLVMDSHIRQVGVMTAENLVAYVQEHPMEDSGYGLVMWSTSVAAVVVGEGPLLGGRKKNKRESN